MGNALTRITVQLLTATIITPNKWIPPPSFSKTFFTEQLIDNWFQPERTLVIE